MNEQAELGGHRRMDGTHKHKTQGDISAYHIESISVT